MKKLIGMTDLILSDEWEGLDESNFIMLMEYAKFLKQKLELWMFVPCKLADGVWVVLEEPKEKDFYTPMPERNGKKVWNTHQATFEIARKEYQEAKESCLFEGFEIGVYPLENLIMHKSGWGLSIKDLHLCTVETYANNGYNLELTQTAQKQLGWI